MTLVLDGARMAELLRSPQGPVMRHMIERATEFQKAARDQLAPHRKTGCLADGIVKRVEEINGEVVIRVYANTEPCSPTRKAYSLMVHEGTQPHVILPVNADQLAFYWPLGPEGAGMYFFKQVNHPGTTPIKFFADNLPLIAA